jgi:alkylation response protein AidB-like acyl-CoA dehydrogenase
MQVGVAETALALIVEYAKVRETFGRKIAAARPRSGRLRSSATSSRSTSACSA